MDMMIQAENEKIRQLHSGYEQKDIIPKEPVFHNINYYKTFKKSYHVLGQLESIVLKDMGSEVTGWDLAPQTQIKNLYSTRRNDQSRADLPVIRGAFLRQTLVVCKGRQRGNGGRDAGFGRFGGLNTGS